MQWFLKALSQYADFKGRARRKEYWMFYLFACIIIVIAMILDNLLGITFSLHGESLGYGWLYLITALGLFVPTLAVAVRRLHDIGKSGWWYLVILIPLVGVIWLIVLLATDGEKGENKWGTNPKEISE